MLEVSQEEIMTSKNNWDPSKYNDSEGSAKLCIQQFPPTSIESTDSFYNVEGNIRAHVSVTKILSLAIQQVRVVEYRDVFSDPELERKKGRNVTTLKGIKSRGRTYLKKTKTKRKYLIYQYIFLSDLQR